MTISVHPQFINSVSHYGMGLLYVIPKYIISIASLVSGDKQA